MPIEQEHRLNLPTLTVFSAAAKASTPRVQNVFLAHRIVLEPECAHVDLHVHDVVDQVVVLVLAVGGEEHVRVLPSMSPRRPNTDTMLATLPLPM